MRLFASMHQAVTQNVIIFFCGLFLPSYLVLLDCNVDSNTAAFISTNVIVINEFN